MSIDDRERERPSGSHRRSRSRDRHGGGSSGGSGIGGGSSSSSSRNRSRSPTSSSRRSKRPSGWDVPPSAETIAHAALIAQAYSQHGDKSDHRSGGGGGGVGGRGGGTSGGGGGVGFRMDEPSGLQQAFGSAGMMLGAVSGNRGPMNSERMAMIAGAPPPLAPLALGSLGALGLGLGGAMGGANAANKPLRRIYVGNLPPYAVEEQVRIFFNDVMRTACSNLEPGDPVLSVYLNGEKKFAFVEFRSVEEAAAAVELDGVSYSGTQLKVRRPSDFNAAMMPPFAPNAPKIDMSKIGVVSTQVPDGPNKVFCGGLPYDLGEEQIKELLSAYGRLKSFHLVREKDTVTSKGYCFFEYTDENLTEPAIAGLNGIALGDKTLTVRRAQPRGAGAVAPGAYPPPAQFGGAAPTAGSMGLGAMPLAFAQAPPPPPPPMQHIPLSTNPFEVPAVLNQPSRVLCLLSMVDAEELRDDQEYADIKEDIIDECGKFGLVSQVVIPRPDPRGAPVPGLGKVFVEFANAEQCAAAKRNLEGRKFADRTVIATSYPEAHFASRAFY